MVRRVPTTGPMRYVYLGTADTDPALKGQPCDPIRRADGRCVVGRGNALVRFADGSTRVVVRRRLRLSNKREGEA